MRPISPRVKKTINEDSFYRRCCITGDLNVSMEHCWIYQGKQIDEAWAIVPLRRDLNTSHPLKEIKDRCRIISLSRATDEELAKYPKKDWKQIKKYLTKKYGNSLM